MGEKTVKDGRKTVIGTQIMVYRRNKSVIRRQGLEVRVIFGREECLPRFVMANVCGGFKGGELGVMEHCFPRITWWSLHVMERSQNAIILCRLISLQSSSCARLSRYLHSLLLNLIILGSFYYSIVLGCSFFCLTSESSSATFLSVLFIYLFFFLVKTCAKHSPYSEYFELFLKPWSIVQILTEI